MKAAKNLVITVLTSAVLILAMGLLFGSANGDAVISRQFFEARIRAADSSKNLVRLVEDSLKNLRTVEQMEKNRQMKPALEIVNFELTNSRERQNVAVALSGHLENMAQATNGMTPENAERLAVEAVSSGVSLVSHLITYNNLLNEVFATFQESMNNGNGASGLIGPIVDEMNAEARAINNIGARFNELLQEFDEKYVAEDSR